VLNIPCLVCKRCQKPFPLPTPKNRVAANDQRPWPSDGKPRNFLCPHCKRVLEYSHLDIQDRLLDDKALGTFAKGYSVALVEVPCDEQGCKARVKIRIVVPFDAVLRAMIPELLLGSIAHRVPCGNGHSKFGQCDAELSAEACFDPEWESVLLLGGDLSPGSDAEG